MEVKSRAFDKTGTVVRAVWFPIKAEICFQENLLRGKFQLKIFKNSNQFTIVWTKKFNIFEHRMRVQQSNLVEDCKPCELPC